MGCTGSSSLCTGFLQLQGAVAPLQLRCESFSWWWLLLLWSTVSRVHRLQQLWHMGSVVGVSWLQSTGSAVVVHKLICSAACGIFLDQGPNLFLLHQQGDSLPLSHQRSPVLSIFFCLFVLSIFNWGACFLVEVQVLFVYIRYKYFFIRYVFCRYFL